jgi:cap2 methyltransferase
MHVSAVPRKRHATDDNDEITSMNKRAKELLPTVDSVHSNPHLRQVTQANCGYKSLTDIEFSRRLAPDAPRQKYRRRQGELKTVIHWGQRKLLLSEIEFLTMYGVPGATVVYAGAAPGTHTSYIVDLFPELQFVLVDPASFSDKLTEGPRCVLRQELFTDDLAREFEKNGNVLFVCDIRSSDRSLMNDNEIEDTIMKDMQAQQKWHDIIKPIKSMLKFRLPWTGGKTEYLAGDVYIQAFGPITTTETRLIPHGHDRVMWDNQKYEEQMFHFNTVTRVARYPHHMPVGSPGYGLDYCYDCRSEVAILLQYLHKTQPELQDEQQQQRFCEMTCRCNRESAPDRTLMDANSDPEERNIGIRRLQWINGKPAYHTDNVNPKSKQIVYSDTAKAMMTNMGFKEDSGLGQRGQGISEPVVQSAQFRRRGIGLCANH